ncbi:MAG TPA: dienelactone hydrolase family protein [Spirochaetia bacterium]|nr:dienelactone hydrolase family protein [Spirochaetia bacterium]
MGVNLRKVLGIAAIAAASMAVPAFADTDPFSRGRTNVSFKAVDGTQLHGYLAQPPGGGKAPGILMIHEWWGLNSNITALADALASEGFIVLAADAFRGSVARTGEEAMRQVSDTPAAQMASDLDDALQFLEKQPRVDAAKVAVQGFCFGGTQAMYMGTRRPDLSAVAIFYGTGPITDPAKLGSMKEAGPVLGIYGAQDGNIPVSQVEGFKRALDARGVQNTIEVYPGVGHAFVKSDNLQNGGQAQKAWNQLVGFLKSTLK